MTPKERLLSAIHFKPVDMPSLTYYYTEVGYAEHGKKLLELYERYPGDAAPIPTFDFSELPKQANYHKIETDIWGTTWEYRTYGRIGHAIGFPLDKLENLASYTLPAMPLSDPQALEGLREHVRLFGGTYPIGYGIPGLFEKMIALCPFENALIDLALEEPLLEELADRLTSHYTEEVERALSAGVDIISIGDDYGDERSLLMAPDMWRRFFLLRLKRIIAPVKKAGKTCCFHSCGQVWDILADIKEAGADSIWPQLPLYNRKDLAEKLRGLNLALCIHIDRGELMQRGTPEQIKKEVEKIYRDFQPHEGGSWFYFEVDEGFPFENILALAEAINQYRR
jgi:uroporphyrinogen decarboxylase